MTGCKSTGVLWLKPPFTLYIRWPNELRSNRKPPHWFFIRQGGKPMQCKGTTVQTSWAESMLCSFAFRQQQKTFHRAAQHEVTQKRSCLEDGWLRGLQTLLWIVWMVYWLLIVRATVHWETKSPTNKPLDCFHTEDFITEHFDSYLVCLDRSATHLWLLCLNGVDGI